MSQVWIEAQSSPPWTSRVYARTSFAPVWVGLSIALLYLACVAIYFAAVGELGEPGPGVSTFWIGPGWWSVIVNAAMIGASPTILVYSLRTAEQDVRDLAPALGDSPAELQERIREITQLNPRLLRAWGVAAIALTTAFTFLDPGFWSTRERPPLTDPWMIWFLVQQSLLGWLLARAIATDVMTALAFSRLADRLRNVDLLDLRPLAVFGRRGVRSVLYWMATLAIFSLFWLAPNAGRGNIAAFVLLLTLAGGNLTVLMLRAQRRVHREKIQQLERLWVAIRADQKALQSDPTGSANAAARLLALYAAEARIHAVSEWPFDASSVIRFAVYLTIGVGSWVGGALVERLLGAAMD